ncbi:MAG: Smr/MutS family protein [Bacteroidales bacterium]|nr:Smr/MutS family protein [Bacteroidales bacterium]
MNTLEEKVGFSFIRERIKQHCSTNYGRVRAESESISDSAVAIERRLALTEEMLTIYRLERRFPQGEFTDCTAFLPALSAPHSSISIENLRRLASFMENLRQLLSFFRSCKEGAYPALMQFSSAIDFNTEIAAKIDTLLDKNGDIKESATPELYKICKELNSIQNSIGRRVEALLKKAKEEGFADADATVSVRDGKLLIPLSSYNKRSIAGIVQDESASGKTFFVEPLEVVELNNKVRSLMFEKQREIAKILMEFTEQIRPYIPTLLEGAKFVGEIDFIRAKAECAHQMECGKPIISHNGSLKIVKGRHPLLESALFKEGKKMVPVDLELDRAHHILIISGPNAGGKSVCLKTTGLLQYMFQWGMLTSCSAVSEFPIFKNIAIDIGDEQSMENDLSTYSSHLLNMRNLLKEATESTLVLIDEFGSGTEPAAGGAIAEAILEELEGRGTYGVITTHYTNLKIFAESSNGVVNGAMQFDAVNIRPLYKLEIGVPGNSFAFDLARKTGLPEQIVKRAEQKAGESFIDLEKQLRKISKNRRKLDEKLAKVKSADKTLESVTEQYTQELQDIKKAKREILEKAKEEARLILADANRQVEQTIKQIKERQAERQATKIAREQLKEFGSSLESEQLSAEDKKIEAKMEALLRRKQRQKQRKEKRAEQESHSEPNKESEMQLELKIGSKVKVEGSALAGEVIKIEKEWVTISVGEISSRVKRKDIKVISNKEFGSVAAVQRAVRSGYSVNVDENIRRRKLEFKTEIDIRGQRLEEAVATISRFIDDAVMVGAPQVRILHGKGTGVLREELRKFLKTNPSVVSCQDEDVRFGGAGITIVTLQ